METCPTKHHIVRVCDSQWLSVMTPMDTSTDKSNSKALFCQNEK